MTKTSKQTNNHKKIAWSRMNVSCEWQTHKQNAHTETRQRSLASIVSCNVQQAKSREKKCARTHTLTQGERGRESGNEPTWTLFLCHSLPLILLATFTHRTLCVIQVIYFWSLPLLSSSSSLLLYTVDLELSCTIHFVFSLFVFRTVIQTEGTNQKTIWKIPAQKE